MSEGALTFVVGLSIGIYAIAWLWLVMRIAPWRALNVGMVEFLCFLSFAGATGVFFTPEPWRATFMAILCFVSLATAAWAWEERQRTH